MQKFNTVFEADHIIVGSVAHFRQKVERAECGRPPVQRSLLAALGRRPGPSMQDLVQWADTLAGV